MIAPLMLQTTRYRGRNSCNCYGRVCGDAKVDEKKNVAVLKIVPEEHVCIPKLDQ
jgi:hypothetical protein